MVLVRCGGSDLVWIQISRGSGVIEGDLVWIQIGGGSGVVEGNLVWLHVLCWGKERKDGVFAESSSC